MSIEIIELLRTKDGVVRVVNDPKTGCSIEMTTTNGIQLKYITEDLYDWLIKELSNQKGVIK